MFRAAAVKQFFGQHNRDALEVLSTCVHDRGRWVDAGISTWTDSRLQCSRDPHCFARTTLEAPSRACHGGRECGVGVWGDVAWPSLRFLCGNSSLALATLCITTKVIKAVAGKKCNGMRSGTCGGGGKDAQTRQMCVSESKRNKCSGVHSKC